MKKGDYVRIIGEYDGNKHCIGKVVKIVYIHVGTVRTMYDVEFEEKIPKGHSGNGKVGKNGHVWCYLKKYLELANKYEVELI